jgi:chaperone BCS1
MEGRIRTLESVILEKSEDILKDMHTFLMSKEWYNRMGIPYRRGYLFHGPPGNGKTSLCKAFAGELQLDICVLSLSSPDVTDGKLTQILRVTPVRSLVLLEDVDAVFVQRETSEPIKLSFSGLLNAIDGVVSQEGRIFIMTTNHIEKLDPALIRPGRCDVKLEVRNASRSQLAAMFVRFFPGRDAEAGSFADQIPEYRVSMAEIQNHLLQHKDSPERALETAGLLLK